MERHTDQHMTEGSPERGFLGHGFLPVVLALAAGASWYLLAATDAEGFLPVVLEVLTLGLAVAFGASLSKVRGLVMSAVIAAAVMVGAVLGADDLSRYTYEGEELFVVLAVAAVTILVLAFWLIGVVIGWAWRRARR